MPTLNLGVIDQPYETPPATAPKPVATPRKGRANRPVRTEERLSEVVTTGDVATWLEDKYHPFEVFYELHQAGIAALVTESVGDAVEALMAGAPPSIDPFGAATSQIEAMFKKFLSEGEMEQLGIPGVPTQAAMDGVSHRFKSGKNPAGDRPSFIDTGLYQASAKAWVT